MILKAHGRVRCRATRKNNDPQFGISTAWARKGKTSLKIIDGATIEDSFRKTRSDGRYWASEIRLHSRASSRSLKSSSSVSRTLIVALFPLADTCVRIRLGLCYKPRVRLEGVALTASLCSGDLVYRLTRFLKTGKPVSRAVT